MLGLQYTVINQTWMVSMRNLKVSIESQISADLSNFLTRIPTKAIGYIKHCENPLLFPKL